MLQRTPLQTPGLVHHLTVVLILFFSQKKAQNDVVACPRHPRERLPTIAPQILDSVPKINLEIVRFFVSDDNFELRVNEIAFQHWKIQYFAKFVNG